MNEALCAPFSFLWVRRFSEIFPVFLVGVLLFPQQVWAITPSRIDIDTCVRVCRAEVDTLSWQPSEQKPGSPPNDGSWQDDSARDRTLKRMAKIIVGLYENGKPDAVATPISKKKNKDGYQKDRCQSACEAAFECFSGMSAEEFQAWAKENNHYYKRFWKRNTDGTRSPGNGNPPGYSEPNDDGTPADPPAPDWDREPDTRSDSEQYSYDNGMDEWVEFVFPMGIP